jgi:hypothetical protein
LLGQPFGRRTSRIDHWRRTSEFKSAKSLSLWAGRRLSAALNLRGSFRAFAANSLQTRPKTPLAWLAPPASETAGKRDNDELHSAADLRFLLRLFALVMGHRVDLGGLEVFTARGAQPPSSDASKH